MLGCYGSTRLHGAGEVTRKDGAYFGPPKPETGLTTTFKKPPASTHSGDEHPFHYNDRRKGLVPSIEEKPIMGITTSKNFITANAVEAILQGKSPFQLS
jgi:hypothetical protein